ncbi:flavodoxin family protein [Iodobacter sp. LRB]|uniref:flavodoxin family protein n=1 Tax=unclassified Iodobacter TaxID=235634 RepID=UPI000C0D6C7E|nr:flavodoxin family protein [Iodobacter sp. BJB302]PHV01854.1 flavodoxin [Iodobacter sp. BJB302]
MPSIVIIYHSASGTTAQLADAIFAGAQELATPSVYRISGAEIIAGRFKNEEIWAQLDQADAIIFGSPTYMGGPSAQFKAFADASGERWSQRAWANKIAAGFTIGTLANGDQSSTLLSFSVFAAQHGMLWCGLDIAGGHDEQGRNRLGTQLGVAAQSNDGQVNAIDLMTAHYLGKRVAQIALKMSNKPIAKDTP